MALEVVQTRTERYVTGSWSDISAFVVGDIEGESMIATNEPDDLLALMGEVTLVMNNVNGNFSPNSAFNKGTPVRITTTYDGVAKTKFKGVILDLDPDTLEWGDQYVRVTVVDWLTYAINYPMITPKIQTDLGADDAVPYLLSLISQQPDSTTIHPSRETLSVVFNAIQKDTRLYSELYKLALSEFAPIYLRAGNHLVVESANTRHGQRTLTEIPVSPSNLHAILTDPNGGAILTIEGTSFAILADELFVPNLATGTIQPIDIDIVHGDRLKNHVSIRAYPTRVDTSPQILFRLNTPVGIPALRTVEIKGTWANPDGGSPINAINIQTMVTGTNYQAFAGRDGSGQERTANLVITPRAGSEGFSYLVYNSSYAAWVTKFNIEGYGIYPYNPIEAIVSVTGSVVEHGDNYLEVDQKYQDDIRVGNSIAEIITDDEKEPRNVLMSIYFDASSSPELMQASQYVDTGDLTWIKNVKPAMDTYAYIQGKKWRITPAGVVTEQWYLKETDSLRKGLTAVSLNYPFVNTSRNAVDFGVAPTVSNLPVKTITGWVYNQLANPSIAPPMAKYDGENGWWMFQLGAGGVLEYRQNRTPNDGQWQTPTGTISGSCWYHFAVAYDATGAENDPIFYVNGSQVSLTEVAIPSGDVDDDDNANFLIGNTNFPSFEYIYTHFGKYKDMRVYNRMLSSAEVRQLYNNPNDPFVVNDGLIFQAPSVKTEDYGMLTGTVMYPENKIIDNIYGIRGTPHWNFPSGTAYAVRIGDPTI